MTRDPPGTLNLAHHGFQLVDPSRSKHDGCASSPTEVRLSSEVRRQTWTGCQGSGTVVFYIIDGGGHTWPGAIDIGGLGTTTKQIDASATIWDFFKSHPLA